MKISKFRKFDFAGTVGLPIRSNLAKNLPDSIGSVHHLSKAGGDEIPDNEKHGFSFTQSDLDWLASLYYIDTGTVWLTQWLIFKSLILDSTHHQNSGKYTFPNLCDLLVPWTIWSSRKSEYKVQKINDHFYVNNHNSPQNQQQNIIKSLIICFLHSYTSEDACNL